MVRMPSWPSVMAVAPPWGYTAQGMREFLMAPKTKRSDIPDRANFITSLDASSPDLSTARNPVDSKDFRGSSREWVSWRSLPPSLRFGSARVHSHQRSHFRDNPFLQTCLRSPMIPL